MWTFVVTVMLFLASGLLFMACYLAGQADKDADRIQRRLKCECKDRLVK